MTEQVRESLSVLMDGEASDIDLERVLKHVGRAEVRATWVRYHHVRRRSGPLAGPHIDIDISGRVMAEIAGGRLDGRLDNRAAASPLARWHRMLRPAASFAIAASFFGAVLMVGQFRGPTGELPQPVVGAPVIGAGGTAVRAAFVAPNLKPAAVQMQADYNRLARRQLRHCLVQLAALRDRAEGSCGVADHYQLKMGRAEQVAGRSAVTMRVLPRDIYRYGYRMALDTETGRLLKAQTVAHNGKVLERIVFAKTRSGSPATGEGAESIENIKGVENVGRARHPASALPWQVLWVPDGFTLTADSRGSAFDRSYTDGLASFTVFLETMPELAAPGEGRARKGGAVAYIRGSTLDSQPVLITVLGEVPVNTARMVADSIRWEGAGAGEDPDAN